MKSRTITTIGIITAILMTVSGAELAFARGGGGGGKSGGSCKGAGSGANVGVGMSQKGNTNQYKQQNQYQYRQDRGASTVGSENGKKQGNQAQSWDRTQLRDPSTHEIEISE